MNNDYARRYPDKHQPMVRPGDVVGGATFSVGRAGLIQVSPYVNYLANDFDRTVKGLNLSTQGSSLFRQVHELHIKVTLVMTKYIRQLRRKFTLEVSDLTLRSLLDQVIKESPTSKHWVMVNKVSAKRIFLRVHAGPEISPTEPKAPNT